MKTLIKNKKDFFIIIGSVAIALALARLTALFTSSVTNVDAIMSFVFASITLASAIMLLVSGISEKYEKNIFISEVLLASALIGKYLLNAINITGLSGAFSVAFMLCLAIAYLVFLVLTFKDQKYQMIKKVFTYILGTFFLLDVVSSGAVLSMAWLLILVGSLFNLYGKKENENEN